jgi:outer membrane immunogenic protein
LSQNFAEPGAFLCDLSFPCIETPFHFSGSPSSFTAGGFGGYRVQLGILVVGAEADVAFKRAQTSLFQADLSSQGVSETFTGRLQQGWDGSLRGRLGILVTPSLLAYATGGGAIGNVAGAFSYNAEFPCCFIPTVFGSGHWSETRTGYTVGGGLETALLGPVKARIEYRYTDFGNISQTVHLDSIGCTPGVFACGSHAHIDTRAAFNTVRLGLGVDF